MRLIRHSVLLALGAWLVQSSSLLAQNPSCPVPIVDCSGNGQSSTIKFRVGGALQNDVTVHPGDTLFYEVTVGVPKDLSCAATNVDAFLAFPDGTVVQFLSKACIAGNGGSISCPSTNAACINTNLLQYTVRTQDVGKAFFLSEPNNLPSSGTNTCFVSPPPHRVGAVLNAVGVSAGPTAINTYSSCNNITALVITPCIACTKFCTNNVGENGTIFFSGTVSNCGTNTGSERLRDITVSNLVNGVLTLVTNIPGLDAGQSATFSGSYSNANICAPITDTIMVGGTDFADGPYRQTFTNSCSATCSNVISSAISVTKFCPPGPVEPGRPLVFSGIVSNAGNVTLTNVLIVNNQPANNTSVFGPITLRPGQSTNFTGSYTVPLDSCGPYTDTLTASGTSVCGGIVTDTDTQTCPGTNSPSIAVRKNCPPGPIQPGQLLTITGTVTNTGNITLTNVTVTNVIAALGVSRQVLGPISLAPGAGTTFTDSYVLPLDSCGPYRDTVLAAGADKCFGRVVTSTDFKDCPGTNSPAIAVTKSCPSGPIQPGQVLAITGTVTNTGNITLTNVTVTNVIAALGVSRQVLGPISLAPGAGTTFTDSYVLPLDSCGPYRDTVLAAGADKCFGRIVTASDFKDCPGTNSPAIVVNKSCPAGPIQPGQVLTITGSVTNTGNITLTNVTVTNAITALGASRRLLGPISLAPGAGTTFTDSYVVPLESCGPYRDTVLAAGADK